MTKSKGGGDVTTVFILLLGCIFIFCVLAVLLLGVDVYRGVAQRGLDGYGERTCLAYIAAKVRHTDREGAVAVSDFEGIPALELTETYGDVEYVTMIYLWEGNICELFFEKSLGLPPSAGNPIAEAKSLDFQETDEGLIVIECDAGGGDVSLVLSPRSGGGEGR